MSDNIKAIKFLSGLRTDQHGNTIKDYLSFSEEEMESNHGWIQWAFPIDTISGHNLYAPVIDDYAVEILNNDDCASFYHSKILEKYLSSIGINVVGHSQYEFADNGEKFLSVVDCPHNHHMLRIARVLRNLYLFDLQSHCDGLLKCLLDFAEEHHYNFFSYTIIKWVNNTR